MTISHLKFTAAGPFQITVRSTNAAISEVNNAVTVVGSDTVVANTGDIQSAVNDINTELQFTTDLVNQAKAMVNFPADKLKILTDTQTALTAMKSATYVTV